MRLPVRLLGLSVLALLAVGFLVLASAGSANGMRLFRDENHFLVRQLQWFVVVALPLFVVFWRLDYHVWRNQRWITWLGYLALLGLLVAVLFTDPTEQKGSTRWIGHGMFRLQPSEFAKMGVVLMLSVFLDRLGWMLGKFWRGAILSSLIVGAPMALLVLEPDFGATIVIAVTCAFILLLAGMRWAHIVFLGAVGALVVGVALWHNPNRMNRINAWGNKLTHVFESEEELAAKAARQQKYVERGIDMMEQSETSVDVLVLAKGLLPHTRKLDIENAEAAEKSIAAILHKRLEPPTAHDKPADAAAPRLPLGMADGQELAALKKELADRAKRRDKEKAGIYQLDQALIAIQGSEIWGRGYMKSLQKKLYLPENHTDFIFAIGAEELGILFSFGVLGCFCLFFSCGMYISLRAPDRFGRLLAAGCSFLIFFQALFNMAVVTGCLPTKGIALPFISYGGTNLVTAMVATGLLFSIGRRIELQKPRPKSTISPVFSQQGV